MALPRTRDAELAAFEAWFYTADAPRLLVLEDVHGDKDAVEALLSVMDLFSIEMSASHGCVVVLTAPRPLDGPVSLSLT